MTNGGFEDAAGWEIPITGYPAAYSEAQAHTGVRSMRVGIITPGDNIESYSSIRQLIAIPADADSVTLDFWWYTVSGDTAALGPMPFRPGTRPEDTPLLADAQYVLVLNEANEILEYLLWQLSDDQQWSFHSFDLSAYADQTIKLHFGAYNDGFGGVTGVYVDDVVLEVCTGP